MSHPGIAKKIALHILHPLRSRQSSRFGGRKILRIYHCRGLFKSLCRVWQSGEPNERADHWESRRQLRANWRWALEEHVEGDTKHPAMMAASATAGVLVRNAEWWRARATTCHPTTIVRTKMDFQSDPVGITFVDGCSGNGYGGGCSGAAGVGRVSGPATISQMPSVISKGTEGTKVDAGIPYGTSRLRVGLKV